MDINEFETELRVNLSKLTYVKELEIVSQDDFRFDSKAILEEYYFLQIFFSSKLMIMNFSLVYL